MKRTSGIAKFAGRWYLPCAVSLWVLMPEVRRLVDWQIGANSISILSVVPLLFLLAIVLPVVRNVASPHLTLPYRIICYTWLFAFVYAFVVALAAGGRLGAVFQLLQFCLPFACGAWVIIRPASRGETFRQLTNTFLWVGAFVGVYGVYQYVAPPPWDVAWVNNSGLGSIGEPEPFGLRVFSTLNAPSTAAFFFVFVILIGLHKLDLRRPGPVLSITVCVAALALTNVRSAWLALAVGIAAFFIVSPKRLRPLVALAAVGIVSVALVLNASTLLGYRDVTTQLVARFNTLSDVDNDYSVNDRQRESAQAAHAAVAEPLGQGLGTVGTATKLGGGGQLTLDNGYLARFLEMGVAGFASYLLTIGASLYFSLRALVEAGARKDVKWQQIAATAICVQTALLGFELSGDAHVALPGLVFWILLGLTLRHEGRDRLPASRLTFEGPRPTSAKRQLWV